jgi:hypothetical protein
VIKGGTNFSTENRENVAVCQESAGNIFRQLIAENHQGFLREFAISIGSKASQVSVVIFEWDGMQTKMSVYNVRFF